MTSEPSPKTRRGVMHSERRVGLTESLPEEWVEAVRHATVPDEYAVLDAELK